MKLDQLRSIQSHTNPPELLTCSSVCGLLYTYAETLRDGEPVEHQQLFQEDGPVLLRGLSEQPLVAVSGRAVVVVHFDNGFV